MSSHAEIREFAKELRGWADCDARAGEPLGVLMRLAADKLEELAAEVERVRDGNRYAHLEQIAIKRAEKAEATIKVQDEQLLALRKWRQEYVGKLTIAEAARAEKDKEIAALREALEHVTELLVDTWNTKMDGDPERQVAVRDARAALKEADDDRA